MTPSYLTYLNGPDIETLALTDDEILHAIESSLASQGRGECVIEPRMHLAPKSLLQTKDLAGVLKGDAAHGSFGERWQEIVPDLLDDLFIAILKTTTGVAADHEVG